MTETPLSAARRLATPDRATLLGNERRARRRTLGWLGAEIAVAAGCLSWVAARGQPVGTLESVLLVAVAVGGLVDWLPAAWGANRKRLRDVRADARFGTHTRDSLLACVDRVATRMGITAVCPVYLVRDKELNAEAVPASLLPGCGSLATVQLNRAILHLLDDRELEWVIGHDRGLHRGDRVRAPPAARPTARRDRRPVRLASELVPADALPVAVAARPPRVTVARSQALPAPAAGRRDEPKPAASAAQGTAEVRRRPPVTTAPPSVPRSAGRA